MSRFANRKIVRHENVLVQRDGFRIIAAGIGFRVMNRGTMVAETDSILDAEMILDAALARRNSRFVAAIAAQLAREETSYDDIERQSELQREECAAMRANGRSAIGFDENGGAI
jgi:hypothetical protein